MTNNFEWKTVKIEKAKRSPTVVKQVLKKYPLCVSCCSQDRLQSHHIIPVSKGGDDTVANCRTLCWKCHRIWHWFFEESVIILEEPYFKVITDTKEKFEHWVKHSTPYSGQKESVEEFKYKKMKRLQEYLAQTLVEYS